jgi:HEAT repeat protein
MILLAKRKDPGIVPALIEMVLTSEDPISRTVAAEGLGYIATPEAVSTLVKAVLTP